MVFVNDPDGVPAGAITGTEIVQVPTAAGLPAGIVPPANVTLVAVVETVPGGIQVLVAAPFTVSRAGILSVTFTPVYGVLFGFCNVIISVVVPPAETVEGENRFVRPISRTVNRAEAAVELVSPCWVWSALAGILLV